MVLLSVRLVRRSFWGYFQATYPSFSGGGWSLHQRRGSTVVGNVGPLAGIPRSEKIVMLEAGENNLAALTSDGAAFEALCDVREFYDRASGSVEVLQSCLALDHLPSPSGPVSDIALLPNGRLLGIAANSLVVSWVDGHPVTESVFPDDGEDSLCGIFVSRDGRVTAAGQQTVLERDGSGDGYSFDGSHAGSSEGARMNSS
jgi:hypothetical protein